MPRKRRNVSVLLLEDREDLGEVGKIVDVRPGYAHNYLYPTGIASPVTPEALRRVERAKQRASKSRAQRAARVAEAARDLEGLSLTIEERASEEGHLFGSVGAHAIVEALGAKGIAIEEKQVQLDHPIKELGIFNVPIQLDATQSVGVRIWVVETGT